MAMMRPTVVMATTSTPSVMMPASAVMAPAMTSAMSMAALDLDDGIIRIRHAERIRRGDGHRRRRQGWRERQSAGGKSDEQEPFHESVSSLDVA